MTTAYDVYDGWTDERNTDQVIEGHEEMIADVTAYADGGFDINLNREVAEKIVAAFEHMKAYEGGADIDEHYKTVQAPLEEIEL